MNNPPSTRSELVTALGLRAHEQYEEFQSVDVACDDFLRCIEDWLHTPWETLAMYGNCYASREALVGELRILAEDQNTNRIFKIIGRQPWSQDGWECAADAMVALVESKLHRPWEELYRTFNPSPRLVEPRHDGKIQEREKGI